VLPQARRIPLSVLPLGDAIDFAQKPRSFHPHIFTGARTQHGNRILRRFCTEINGIIRKYCKY
jgi:hypothetical protein